MIYNIFSINLLLKLLVSNIWLNIIFIVKWPKEIFDEVFHVLIMDKYLPWESEACKVPFKEEYFLRF